MARKTSSANQAKRLRPGFSAIVQTTETAIANTIAGPVPMPVEVHIPAGGELPDNMADGQYDKLEKLGAFTPLPPKPAVGLVREVDGQTALATAQGSEYNTTPSDQRPLTADEISAQEAFAAASAHVQETFAAAEAEALTAADGAPAPVES